MTYVLSCVCPETTSMLFKYISNTLQFILGKQITTFTLVIFFLVKMLSLSLKKIHNGLPDDFLKPGHIKYIFPWQNESTSIILK